MYCDGPCDWWEPTSLLFFGMLSLSVIVPLIVTYGIYRLVRRIRRDRHDEAG